MQHFEVQKDSYVFKTRKKSRVLWWWVGGSAFFIAAFIGIAYMVLYSGLFTVKQFSVSGETSLSPDTIIAKLSEVKLSDALHAWLGPQNVLFWFLGDQAAGNTRTLPGLATISLATNIFKRDVMIRVESRELSGVWCVMEHECYGFDTDGVLFTRVPDASGALILKIDDTNHRPVVLGANPLPRSEWLANILSAVGSMKRSMLAVRAIRIRDSSLEEWEAELSSGTLLYFSLHFTPSNLDRVFASIGEKVSLNRVAYLDFRVPNKIYYK